MRLTITTLFSLGVLLTACDLKVDGEIPSITDAADADEAGEVVDEGGDEGAEWGWGELTCEEECAMSAAFLEEDCLAAGMPPDLCAEVVWTTYDECITSCDDLGDGGSGDPTAEECIALADAAFFECLAVGIDPETCFVEAEALLSDCLGAGGGGGEPDERELECTESAAIIEAECVGAGVDPGLCFELSAVFFEECLSVDSCDDDPGDDGLGECEAAAAEAEGMCLEAGGPPEVCLEIGAAALEDCERGTALPY